MAAMGFGYWALATQYLMYIAVNTMLLWYFSEWRPSISRNEEGETRKENSYEADQTTPNRRLLHEDAIAYSGGENTLQGNLVPRSSFLVPRIFHPLKKIFPFSFRIMLSAIFTQLNNNVMNLLLGHYYGKTNTGHYNQAYQWSSKCFLLVGNMLRQVDQTVLVGLRDERERQLAVLRKMMRFTAFISFPLLFCLAMVSHEFIVLAIGEKWAFAASLLPLLCLSGAFMPLSTLLTDSVISQHRSDIYLWSTVALGMLQIVMMVSLWRQGIVVMVWAYTLLNIIWVFVWHFFVRRLMGYGLLAFLKDIVPFALAAAGVMLVTYFATQAISVLWLKLLCRVAIATLLYYAVMRLAGAVILKEVIGFFTRGRKGIS
jgi:O-antigen/teichoic acid export membrane protein